MKEKKSPKLQRITIPFPRRKMKNPAARPQGILPQGILLNHIRSLTHSKLRGMRSLADSFPA